MAPVHDRGELGPRGGQGAVSWENIQVGKGWVEGRVRWRMPRPGPRVWWVVMMSGRLSIRGMQ